MEGIVGDLVDKCQSPSTEPLVNPHKLKKFVKYNNLVYISIRKPIGHIIE